MKTDEDLEFESFFARGDRITDVTELFNFAKRSEQRGERTEARQLYRWTGELLDECPHDSDLIGLRFEVEDALRRLQ